MKIKKPTEIEHVRPSRPTAASAPVKAPDRVSVERADEIQAAVTTARSIAQGARSARLQAVENAVRSGHYKPDPRQIAQRIVDAAELDALIQAALHFPK